MKYYLSTDISSYNKGKLIIREPLVVAHFSKRNVHYQLGHKARRFCEFSAAEDGDNDKVSKTVNVPFIGVNMANEFRSLPARMTEFCSAGERIYDYLAMSRLSNFSLSIRCSDFIADVGTLVKIAMTPYASAAPDFAWSVRCCRMDRAIFIQLDSASHSQGQPVVNLFKHRYCREKFLRMCCGEDETDIHITPESLVDRKNKCYRVNKTYLTKNNEKIRLFYANEEHCIRDEKPLIIDAYEADGLGKAADWLTRSLAWYLEAELTGVERLLTGLYSPKSQRLTRVVETPIDVLARRATWKPDVCYSFLHHVLLKIRDAICEEDFNLNTAVTTIFRASFKPNGKRVVTLQSCGTAPTRDDIC